jgi:hypothetical protein
MVSDGLLVPPGVLDVFEKKLRQLNPNLPTITYEFKDFAAYIDAIVSSQEAMSIQASSCTPMLQLLHPHLCSNHSSSSVTAADVPCHDLMRAACCLVCFT